MDTTQLNNLAVKAKSGDAQSMWEIKLQFQKMIHRLSESNRHQIINQATFEDECFRIIENTVSRYDPTKGNLSQLVVNFIKRRLGQNVTRHKAKTKGAVLICLSGPSGNNPDEEESLEACIKDDLAIVDANFLLKEKIAGLAAGDPKKALVLNSMIEPGYRELHTANLLAQTYGKGVDTNRKFIQRFRQKCMLALEAAN